MKRTIALLVLITLLITSPVFAFSDWVDVSLRDILVAEKERHVDRRAELASARDHGLDQTWWQSGFLKVEDSWQTYDDAVATSPVSEGRQRYEAERFLTGDSPEDQLRLASWCGRNGFHDRERAHLLAALSADPGLQNERLLKRAGFVRILGRWMAKEQRDRIEAEAHRIDDSLNHWQARLSRIERQLRANRATRVNALNELRDLTDPASVAAIDLILGRSRDVGVVRTAIQALGKIDGYESSQVLAKYAVFSDNATIRREATEHLSGRRYEDFVPHMVALMATETRATLTTSRRNHSGISSILLEPEIAVHLKLERVTDEQIQIAHSHLRLVAKIVRVIGFGLPGEELLRGRGYGQATLDFDSRIHSTKRRIDEANELTTQLNGRVSLVLSAVAGRSSNNDPEYWWAWWNAERDVDAGDKAVVEISEDDTVLQEPFVLRWSCFAAETAVWTETGLKPIESIRIGDRVLSKNVESGELAFRSVLKTTVRKAKPLVVIRSDGEEIKATGGHQFWQSGRGWVKARDLEAFGRLHTVTGNAFVNDVRPGPTEQTYNLVVEDSHTYFVGKAGLLVQDLLLTAPTNMVVPGLTRFEMQNLVKAE